MVFEKGTQIAFRVSKFHTSIVSLISPIRHLNDPYFPQNDYIPIPIFHCRTNKRNHMKKYAFYIFAILSENYEYYRGLRD